MCDGSGPCFGNEVRLLPTGGDGNAILCEFCFRREIRWRRERNLELSKDCQFDTPLWIACKVYGKEVSV